MNRKKSGFFIVLLFIVSGFVPGTTGALIETSKNMILEHQNNDPATYCIEAFYVYIGTIRNFTIVEDENREYYQWYAVNLFVFWMYKSTILPYEIGFRLYNDDPFYFFTCPVDQFHGKINSDSILGYYLWI